MKMEYDHGMDRTTEKGALPRPTSSSSSFPCSVSHTFALLGWIHCNGFLRHLFDATGDHGLALNGFSGSIRHAAFLLGVYGEGGCVWWLERLVSV